MTLFLHGATVRRTSDEVSAFFVGLVWLDGCSGLAGRFRLSFAPARAVTDCCGFGRFFATAVFLDAGGVSSITVMSGLADASVVVMAAGGVTKSTVIICESGVSVVVRGAQFPLPV